MIWNIAARRRPYSNRTCDVFSELRHVKGSSASVIPPLLDPQPPSPPPTRRWAFGPASIVHSCCLSGIGDRYYGDDLLCCIPRGQSGTVVEAAKKKTLGAHYLQLICRSIHLHFFRVTNTVGPTLVWSEVTSIVDRSTRRRIGGRPALRRMGAPRARSVSLVACD